jgi:hypothetical protein
MCSAIHLDLLSGGRHPPLLSELRSAIVLSIMIAQALNHSWSELLTLLSLPSR